MKTCGAIFDIDKKRSRLTEIELLSEKPEIWNNQKEMQKLQKERSLLTKAIGEFDQFTRMVDDGQVLLELSVESSDEGSFGEVKTQVALRRGQQGNSTQQKTPPGHAILTSPFRIAYTTSSAVL